MAGHATPHLVYHFVNSYQVKLNRTQTTLAFDKTDLLDLGAIGDLLLRGLGFPAPLPTASDLLVRQEVESLRALQTEQQRVANRVLRTFDQLLPGAFLNSRRFTRAHPELAAPTPLATRPLERQLVEALILLCPNPYTLRDLGVPGLIDLFHAHGYRCGPQTAAKLLAVVARALLPPPEVAPAFAASVQREFQHYQFLAPQVAEALTHLDTLLPTTAARHLLDIPGTSAHLIARYLTGVGPLDNVLFADQVWRKAGMNPGRCSSGDVVLDGAMAKQGDPFFRDTLYRLGYQLARHCGYFTATFLDTVARGKSEVEATIHTAHQVNRVFIHLLQQDEPFAPPTIADYPAFCQQQAARLERYLAQKQAQRRRPRSQPRPRRRPRAQR